MTSRIPGLLADLGSSLERFFGLFGVELETARRQGLRVLAVLLLALIAWYLVRLVAARVVRSADDGDDANLSHREKRAQTIAGLLNGVGRAVILIFAVILILDTFMNIGPLLAGAGIIGLAISFGSQSLVKDVIAGFFILMEHQFDYGDVIEVAGKSGSVERMSLRMVMLRDADGAVHVVPNGQIGTVTNKTRDWSRAVVDVDVDYATDADHAIALLTDEATRFAADPAWRIRLDGEPEVIGVQALGNDALTVRVLLRTRPGQHWAVGREFRRRVKNRLDREGVASPTATQHLLLRREEHQDAGRIRNAPTGDA